MIPVIDQWLSAQRDFEHLPGLSIAIFHGKDLLFAKGYGYADVENKTLMKASTICSICSISKIFTSIAVMQLWENGRLRLDDSIQSLLPDYPIYQQYKNSNSITIREMLTHTSGLTRDADSSWNSPNFYFLTRAERKNSASNLTTVYPSGRYYQYSNLGMGLLGEVISQITMEPYGKYVTDRLLRPLQLTKTRPYLPNNLEKGKLATGYGALDRQGNRKQEPLFNTNAATPAAGFSSNCLILAKFACWQLSLLETDTISVLKSSTLREMQRIQWENPDKTLTWRLGFRIEYHSDGIVTVGHDGSCPGYESLIMVDPKTKFGVVLMINGQGTDVYKFSDQIFSLLSKKITSERADVKKDLSGYAGRYDNYTWSGELVVFPINGKLITLGVPTNNPTEGLKEYKYVGEDTFKLIRPDDQTLGESLIFHRNDSGKIDRLQSFSLRMKKIE